MPQHSPRSSAHIFRGSPDRPPQEYAFVQNPHPALQDSEAMPATPATCDRLPVLRAWLQSLEELGVGSVRMHILEVDDPAIREKCALTIEENVAAFLFFARAEKDFPKLKIDVFTDIRNLLLGKDRNATCIWRGCDPHTTAAVSGVEGHGQRSNCGRTNKDGIDFAKAEFPGYERYLALYHADQER